MRPRLRIGQWTVEPELFQLSRQGEVRRIGAKVMGALLVLAERPGAVVTKEALVDKVWEGASTSDEALAAVIYELRRALDDDAKRPRYVETIRKSGFRLVAEVAELDGDTAMPATQGDPGGASPPAGKTAGLRRLLPAALAAGLVVGGVWLVAGREPPRPTIRSLAVLPVNSFVGDSSELRLADALTAMLTADLAAACPVEMTPGISLRADSAPWNLPRVEAELGVDAVVESAVVRSGDRLWISVELVDTRSGRLLWSGSWDRAGLDTLAVLREVALEVANQVRLEIGPAAGPVGSSSEGPA